MPRRNERDPIILAVKIHRQKMKRGEKEEKIGNQIAKKKKKKRKSLYIDGEPVITFLYRLDMIDQLHMWVSKGKYPTLPPFSW